MKIVRFTPGDGTSYIVLFHRLTAEERKEIGGLDDGAVWFGFGTGSLYEFPSHPFQGHGYLSFDYYLEKMSKNQEITYTHRVGHRVLCMLTRREAGRNPLASYTTSQFEQWESNWTDQLTPLLNGQILYHTKSGPDSEYICDSTGGTYKAFRDQQLCSICHAVLHGE